MNKTTEIKIYYHHTDCGGVVYYGKYLEFLEEARTDFFEKTGLSIKELSGQGLVFVVARQEINYRAPAFYADILKINTRLTDVSRVKLEFQYEIINQNGRIIADAKTIMVSVDTSLKPKAMPKEVCQKFLVKKP